MTLLASGRYDPCMSGEPSSEPATTPPEPRRSSRRGWVIGAATTVGVALVGATASALITPERVDGFFGMFSDSPTPSATPSVTAQFKTVTSLDKSITFEVPANWAARDGRYDVTTFAGSAVMTGTQVDRSIQFGEDGAYIGASGEFATLGQLTEASDEVIEGFLQSAVEELDWTLEGCVPAAAAPLLKDDWFVDSRVWKDCASIAGLKVVGDRDDSR